MPCQDDLTTLLAVVVAVDVSPQYDDMSPQDGDMSCLAILLDGHDSLACNKRVCVTHVDDKQTYTSDTYDTTL